MPFVSALRPWAGLLTRLTTVKPREPRLTVGLDLGSTSVKTVALGPRKGLGPRPVLGQHLVPLDAEQETDASGAIKAAVGALQLSVRSVNLSVSGQWVVMRVIEMPAMEPGEIRQALPFEAQRYLPFSLPDVVLDGVVLGSSDAKRNWVLLVACKKELIERRLDWVKRAGLEAALIDVDALAVANAFVASGNGRDAGRVRSLINVGAQWTNLIILQGEMPYLVRDIPWGAEKLIRAVAEHLSTDPAAVGAALARGELTQDTRGALRLMSEALVTELQLSFDYFENQFGRPPEDVFVTGGLSRSAGFLEALKDHLSQAIAPWAPSRGVSEQFAVAYGLALRTS